MLSRDDSSLLKSIILQLPLIILLGHGYDLLVEYVAARNVSNGLSPYIGGIFHNSSYSPMVQGIGETPLWPLYLSIAFSLSGGDIIVFNALFKIPIALTLPFLYLVMRGVGVRGAEFYLFNPYVLITTVAWGKPDVVACLLILLAIMNTKRMYLSAALMAVSINVKPIGLGVLPAMTAYLHPLGAKFLLSVTALSLAIFFSPFILLEWETSTPISGSINWLGEAGGLSPLNIFEYFYGWRGGEINPYGPIVGVPWLIALLAFTAFIIVRRPKTFEEFIMHALIGSTIFIVFRPWVSEQNLILPFLLMHLKSGTQIRGCLWASLIAFSTLNYSIPQLLYPVWPRVTIDIYNFTWWLEGPRLVARFVSSITFYLLYCLELFKMSRHEKS